MEGLKKLPEDFINKYITIQGPLRSFTVKEDHIGSVVSEDPSLQTKKVLIQIDLIRYIRLKIKNR